MQKALVAAAAFVIGATLGMGLLAAGIVVVGYALTRHGGSARALAAGVSHGTVFAVPVVCGVLAAWWAVRRLNQI